MANITLAMMMLKPDTVSRKGSERPPAPACVGNSIMGVGSGAAVGVAIAVGEGDGVIEGGGVAVTIGKTRVRLVKRSRSGKTSSAVRPT